MAVNPIQFLVASNASITNGSKIVNISGNVDCSRVFSGTAVFLGGADNPAEAVSGTSPDGSGNSTITLRNNWSQGDVVNQQLVSFNTNEGLAEAISNVREIVSNVSAIEDLATQGLIKRISDNTYEVVSISSQGESLIGANDASSQRSVLGLGNAATRNVGTSAGNVMEVGAFGLGGLAESVADNNPELPTGFYSGNGSSSVNFPTSAAKFGSFVNIVRQSNNAINNRLYLYEIGGVPHAQIGVTRDDGTNWSFSELYHSGNSVNPLDYGVGGNTSNFLSANPDMLANLETGFYRTFSSTTGMQSTSGDTVIASRYDNNNNGRRLLLERDSIRFKSQNTDGAWLEEQELYHSGNTNFNEFGGTGADRRIGKGTCRGTTSAFIELPLNSVSNANSVSVTGTFRLTDYTGTNVLVDNIPANAFSLTNTRPSNKLFTLLVNVAGGLTGKDPVYLETASSDAKIVPLF